MPNADVLSKNWKQLRAKLKAHWTALTDDDLKTIDGHRTVLAGVLQDKYGYTSQKAETEIDRFLDEVAGPGEPARRAA